MSAYSRVSDSVSKLSSGLRVQSARDDAASLAIGSRLNAEVAAMRVAGENAQQASSALQIAEGGYATIETILIRLKELSVQAASGQLSSAERSFLDTEFQRLRTEITRISRDTQFNGVTLLRGGSAIRATDIGLNITAAQGYVGISFDRDADVFNTTALPAYATGGSTPHGVVTGDFDNDGNQDMVVADFVIAGPNVGVLLGNGDGTFQTASTVALGVLNRSPNEMTAADFDGDGNLDLAIQTGGIANQVVRLLGNGDGTFSAASAVGDSLGALVDIASADFDGDDNVDLAVVDDSGNAEILLGNGDGTFTAQGGIAISGSGTNTALRAVDIDNDGNVDLVVSRSGDDNVTVLRGNGDGTFQAGVAYATQSSPSDVYVADLNGDGYADLVAANEGSDSVSVFLNNRDGTFASAVNYAVGAAPKSVAVGDFDGDGIKDIAVTDKNDDTISVLSGNGGGTFAAAVTHGTGSAPHGLATADFDGDGVDDLAASNESDGSVSILASGVQAGDGFELAYDTATNRFTLTNTTTGRAYSSAVVSSAPAAGTTRDVRFEGTGMIITLDSNWNPAVALNTNNAFSVISTVSTDLALKFKVGTDGRSEDDIAVALGLASLEGLASGLSAASLVTASGANDAIGVIDEAITAVVSRRADMGAAQNRLEYAVSNLLSLGENVEAGRSTLLDLDVASEISRLTSERILVNSAVALLAQSNITYSRRLLGLFR
ncbi:MAG: VCBS repeat-containing protein [Proteobacteria bacterium]|nr:VCBS repeat-containing protein [Pseudomonadota bacterium]